MLSSLDTVRELLRSKGRRKTEKKLAQYYLSLGRFAVALSRFLDKRNKSSQFIPVNVPDEKILILNKYVSPIRISGLEGKISINSIIIIKAKYIEENKKTKKQYIFLIDPSNPIKTLEFFLNPRLFLCIGYFGVTKTEKKQVINAIIYRLEKERVIRRMREIDSKIKLDDFFLSDFFGFLLGRMSAIVRDISNMLLVFYSL